jgi:16S rRNA (cytosine1402-N4)-methyltransferase
MSAADCAAFHVPVLLHQVLEALAPSRGGRYVDATANGGGHLRAILDTAPAAGRALAIDRDPAILAALATEFAEPIASGRLLLAGGSFAGLADILAAHDFTPIDGILFDLGLSSFHLDRSGRGFSFARDEPLDMRFDPGDDSGESAADILASRDADELTAIFRDYGEERFASRIARTIVARRREQALTTTGQLLAAVEQSLPAATRWRAARDAARIFQALRIAANDELTQVEAALPRAVEALAPGGRIVVIAFHSLEDRLVKRFLRAESATGRLRLLRRKPLMADAAEIATNPRAASAKLRAAERI